MGRWELTRLKSRNYGKSDRKRAWVFQNPDNQIIGTVVEEDVGFGPENMGVPTEQKSGSV